MKNPKPITATVRAAALVGAFSLIALSTTHAQFVPLPSPTPETPGATLNPNTATTGTVVAFRDVNFVDNALPTPFASGTLRSIVVDRGAGLLDFYYQLVNTSPGPDPLGDADFYRLKTIMGFEALGLSVGQTNSLAGLAAGASGINLGSYTQGAGLETAVTADRDVGSVGSVGFDFPTQPPLAFTGDTENVNFGESSSFLVVRTDSTRFTDVTVAISGSATSFASSFAAVPEPSSVLFGLAMFGVTLGSRIKARRAKSA